MTRIITKAEECPVCSRRGGIHYMHVTSWRDVHNAVTRVDELCTRCLWMRQSDAEGNIIAEGRARKERHAA